MLRPHKYLNLNKSVIKISSLIIRYLKENKVLKYSELSQRVNEFYGEDMKQLFVQALNFLYLLGKLDYHRDIDTLELIE